MISSVEWIGIPGYQDGIYHNKFFTPLPQHAWNSYSVEELRTSEVVKSASPWAGAHTSSMNGFRVTISHCIKILFISVPAKIYPALIIWFTGLWVLLMKLWMPCRQVNAI